MAMCSKCKANVGCGCQLREGMCAACYSTSSKKVQIRDLTKDIKKDKDAITKTS